MHVNTNIYTYIYLFIFIYIMHTVSEKWEGTACMGVSQQACDNAWRCQEVCLCPSQIHIVAVLVEKDEELQSRQG